MYIRAKTYLGRREAQLEPFFQHGAPRLKLSPLIFELVDTAGHGDQSAKKKVTKNEFSNVLVVGLWSAQALLRYESARRHTSILYLNRSSRSRLTKASTCSYGTAMMYEQQSVTVAGVQIGAGTRQDLHKVCFARRDSAIILGASQPQFDAGNYVVRLILSFVGIYLVPIKCPDQT